MHALLGTSWVYEAMRWAYLELPIKVVVLLGNQYKLGEMLVME